MTHTHTKVWIKTVQSPSAIQRARKGNIVQLLYMTGNQADAEDCYTMKKKKRGGFYDLMPVKTYAPLMMQGHRIPDGVAIDNDSICGNNVAGLEQHYISHKQVKDADIRHTSIPQHSYL